MGTIAGCQIKGTNGQVFIRNGFLWDQWDNQVLNGKGVT